MILGEQPRLSRTKRVVRALDLIGFFNECGLPELAKKVREDNDIQK